jgi:hypothetical protein
VRKTPTPLDDASECQIFMPAILRLNFAYLTDNSELFVILWDNKVHKLPKHFLCLAGLQYVNDDLSSIAGRTHAAYSVVSRSVD